MVKDIAKKRKIFTALVNYFKKFNRKLDRKERKSKIISLGLGKILSDFESRIFIDLYNPIYYPHILPLEEYNDILTPYFLAILYNYSRPNDIDFFFRNGGDIGELIDEIKNAINFLSNDDIMEYIENTLKEEGPINPFVFSRLNDELKKKYVKLLLKNKIPLDEKTFEYLTPEQKFEFAMSNASLGTPISDKQFKELSKEERWAYLYKLVKKRQSSGIWGNAPTIDVQYHYLEPKYQKILDPILKQIPMWESEKHIKRILKETYDNQQLSDLCNMISTGSNKVTREFMNELQGKLNQMSLSPQIKEKLSNVFNKFNRDTNQVETGIPSNGGLRGATGDSQSDEGDMYLSELQDVICSNYLEALD